MLKRLMTSFAIALVVVLLGIFWIGCSDDTTTTVSSPNSGINSTSGIYYYFPLNEGYTTIYEVEENGITDWITYTVGEEVSFADGTATQWISYSPSNGFDTGYFRVTTNCLYYYERLTSNPEKILELPLEPGKTWSRYSGEPVETLENDDGDIIFDKDILIPDTTSSDNNGATKNYPISGMEDMVVENIETLEMDNSCIYSGAVKVVNNNSYNTYNQYWFAPGIGLVKYIIGASSITVSTGQSSGEIQSYGYK